MRTKLLGNLRGTIHKIENLEGKTTHYGYTIGGAFFATKLVVVNNKFQFEEQLLPGTEEYDDVYNAIQEYLDK